MSRWGSTQTSAQWNTTTMTRVKVSLKTQFCHFLFSKASVFVPFYRMTMKLPIILIFECAGSQYTVDQEKDKETDGRKRYLSIYTICIVNALQRKIQKLTFLLPIQKCLPESFVFSPSSNSCTCVLHLFVLARIIWQNDLERVYLY